MSVSLRGARRRALLPLLGLAVVPMSLAFGVAGAAADDGGGIVSNGTVMLGVNDVGDLNFGSAAPSSGGTYTVGLRYLPSNGEGTAAGCTCEGWGIADATSGEWGGANTARDGVANLAVQSFTHDADHAVSVVRMGSRFEITHDYHPSAKTPNLFEATVKVKNISDSTADLRYRRTMDWDIEPTAFSEYVTIDGGTSSALLASSDNGFAYENPLNPAGQILVSGSFTDSGPADHGANFDFGFGDLAPGATKTFTIFYGAAGNQADALTALGAVGAEVYSLGKPSGPDGLSLGAPNTFIFGFKGVGGAPILPPVDTTPVDTTAPVITSDVTGTVGDNGWYTTNADLTWTVTDGESAISAKTGCDPVAVHHDQAATDYTCTATSAGGTTTKTVSIKRDAAAPVVAVTGVSAGGVYTLGAVPTAGCSTGDATSGVATAATLSTTGGTVGTRTVTCSGGKDKAGNTAAAVSATFTIRYAFTGFQRPIDNGGVFNVVKAGSAVPVKFSLAGNKGLAIFATGSPSTQKISCDASAPTDAVEVTVTPGSSTLAYDAASDTYTYVMKTDSAWTGTCRLLTVTLVDGTSHTAKFKFNK